MAPTDKPADETLECGCVWSWTKEINPFNQWVWLPWRSHFCGTHPAIAPFTEGERRAAG